MTDEEIIEKLSKLFSKMEANNRLQELAKHNGLDVKNTIILTEDDKDNVAVSLVALLIAKREQDPRYHILQKVGLKRRSLKAEIVNNYKEQALELIKRFKDTT